MQITLRRVTNSLVPLVAGRQTVSLDLTVSSRRYSCFLSTFRSQRLYSIVTMTPEMHFNALRSLTQPCLTAYGI